AADRIQHRLHGVLVRDVAAAQHGERAETQALAQKEAALDLGDKGGPLQVLARRRSDLGGRRRFRFSHSAPGGEGCAWTGAGADVLPTIMATRVFGTRMKRTIADMHRKCTMRALSKPPKSQVSSWNCVGFQIDRPERTVRSMAERTPT